MDSSVNRRYMKRLLTYVYIYTYISVSCALHLLTASCCIGLFGHLTLQSSEDVGGIVFNPAPEQYDPKPAWPTVIIHIAAATQERECSGAPGRFARVAGTQACNWSQQVAGQEQRRAVQYLGRGRG